MKLLLSVLLLFLFAGCSDQSKKDTKQVEKVEKKVEVKKEAPKPKKVEVKKAVKIVEPKKDTVKKVVEKTEKIVAKTKEKVKEAAKIATSVTDNKEVKKAVEKVTKALDKIPVATKSKAGGTGDIQNAAAGLVAGLGGGALMGEKKKSSVDGAALFKSKCSSCHGAKAEKKALGKSDIIAKWDIKKISDALQGYKKGTFGGSMKAIMQGQAKGLSDDQISALANAIPKL